MNHGSCAAFHAVEPVAGRSADARPPPAPASTEPVFSASRDAELHRQLGELLQFVVGAEQIDVDALHHLGDRLVGNARELPLQEAEEIEIGGIAEIEELEMVLPGLVEQLDRPVVGLHQRVGVVEADAAR